jgi:hypothetical protein
MKSQAAMVLAAALFAANHLQATNLSTLIRASDAIVVGTEPLPVEAGNAVSFYLTVERVLTGSVPVGSALSVTWTTNQGLQGASGSYRGIWFLKKSADGSWSCLPAGTIGMLTFFPDLSLPVSQAPLPPQLAYDAGATALADQVILEMAAAPPRANSRLLFEVVPRPFSQGALQAFRYLAASPEADRMLLGVTALVEAGDTNGLLLAEKASADLANSAPGADLLATTIKVRFRNPDPLAIAALGRMATAVGTPSLMQNAAAQALVAIHSQDDVPWLGSLLSSSSPQMQIYGAQGLSYFANGVGIPAVETMKSLDHLNKRQPSPYHTSETDRHIGFRAGDQTPFIQYWLDWWQAHPEIHALQSAQ